MVNDQNPPEQGDAMNVKELLVEARKSWQVAFLFFFVGGVAVFVFTSWFNSQLDLHDDIAKIRDEINGVPGSMGIKERLTRIETRLRIAHAFPRSEITDGRVKAVYPDGKLRQLQDADGNTITVIYENEVRPTMLTDTGERPVPWVAIIIGQPAMIAHDKNEDGKEVLKAAMVFESVRQQ